MRYELAAPVDDRTRSILTAGARELAPFLAGVQWLPDRKGIAFDVPETSIPFLQVLLDLMTAIDRHQIATLRLPLLYDAGIGYQPGPFGAEFWNSAAIALRCGSGDCKDFAAWRAAELQLAGEAACAVPLRVPTRRPGALYHVLVKRPGGRFEDPSARLGMLERVA
jgi:hypothetical protein